MASPVTCSCTAIRLSSYLKCIAPRTLAVDVVIVTFARRIISTFVSFPRADEKMAASRIPHGLYLPPRRNTDTVLVLLGLWLVL